ncbi:hypothetical protein OQA88_3219 [Cercophora sp. LCS_1]
MVSLKTCLVNIPAIPNLITVSGRQEIATFAYAPTNTNYFGRMLNDNAIGVAAPTRIEGYTTTTCTLPASISGKAYSVTPVVVFAKAGSYSTTTRKCDPVPVASINKGNFQFACKTVTAKTLESGWHTISWQVPAAASVSIIHNLFPVVQPSTTPVYVVSPARASTTLVPTTAKGVDVTVSTTRTLQTTTSYVRIVTSTSTCSVTTTVTPPTVPLRRRQVHDTKPSVDHNHDDGDDDDDDAKHSEMAVDLKRRAAATPTLAKIDYTYPPYGKTTIYVRSMSTSTYTVWKFTTSTVTPSPVVMTTSVQDWTIHTVTVTRTPTSSSTTKSTSTFT